MRKAQIAKLRGTVRDFCKWLTVTPDEFERCFAELKLTKTATVTQTAEIFTLMSRKYARELKVKEQNRLRKQRQRGHADVTEKSHSHSKSKSLKIEEKEVSYETYKKKTASPNGDSQLRFDRHDAPKLGFAVEQLLDAFPDLVISTANAGLIASTVRDNPPDREAWNITVTTYLANCNPEKNSWMPDRIGTVLGVFRDERAKVERNGHSPPTRTQEKLPTPAEKEAEYEAIRKTLRPPPKKVNA
jgi:hypothetical protein